MPGTVNQSGMLQLTVPQLETLGLTVCKHSLVDRSHTWRRGQACGVKAQAGREQKALARSLPSLDGIGQRLFVLFCRRFRTCDDTRVSDVLVLLHLRQRSQLKYSKSVSHWEHKVRTGSKHRDVSKQHHGRPLSSRSVSCTPTLLQVTASAVDIGMDPGVVNCTQTA